MTQLGSNTQPSACGAKALKEYVTVANTKIESPRNIVQAKYVYSTSLQTSKDSSPQTSKDLTIHELWPLQYSIHFNSVYLPTKGPQGATGKLYIDE